MCLFLRWHFPNCSQQGHWFPKSYFSNIFGKIVKMSLVKYLGGMDEWLFQIFMVRRIETYLMVRGTVLYLYARTIEGNLCTEKPICQRSCTFWASDPRWAKMMSLIMWVLISTSKPFERSPIDKPCQHSVQIPDGGSLLVPTVPQLTTGLGLVSKPNTYLLSCHLQKLHAISQTIMTSISLAVTEYKHGSQISSSPVLQAKPRQLKQKG